MFASYLEFNYFKLINTGTTQLHRGNENTPEWLRAISVPIKKTTVLKYENTIQQKWEHKIITNNSMIVQNIQNRKKLPH